MATGLATSVKLDYQAELGHIGVPTGAAYPVAHMAGHQKSLFVLARRSSYSGRQHQASDTEVDSLPQTGAHAHPKKDGDMKADFGRRALLKGAGAIAGSTTLGIPSLALAQTGPIRIGVTNALSGPNAVFGEANVIGQRLVVAQYNRGGGVLGRQLELVVRDDRAQAAAGTAIIREFAGSAIEFLAGGGATTVAIAYSGLLPELKMLYICSTPGMAITHEAFNRNVFRFNPNAYSLFGAQGRVLAERYPNVTNWGAITPDYAFGHDAARVFSNAVKQYHSKRTTKEFEMANPIVVSGAQTDFRPQINSLMNSNIEGLFIGMPGAPGISFFQQARAVGLDKKLKVMGETSGDVALLALGKDMPDNVWSPVFWPYEREPVKSNKISQQLLADYTATTSKRFPNGHVLRGAIGIRGLLEGIKKAKTTDVPTVIAAMEELSFESEIGPYTVRKADHAGMATLFVGNYNRVETEPFITLKEVRSIPEISVIETPSPGKEYIQ